MTGMAHLLLCAALCVVVARAQYAGEEELDPLQKTAVIGGATRDLDKIGSVISTNRTQTTLNCASGYMNVEVKFDSPFFGIIYPNGSRTSSCLTHGTGELLYTLNLPLKGCGTKRVERRVFMNNIMVRFRKGLELEGDELKTIICRYPSPVVILPPIAPVAHIAPPLPPVIKRIGEVEILMIVCAIVFLALLLVGMACSYTCLKKRNIKLVRRRAPSTAPTSEISKISGSSFMGFKLPRVTTTDTDTTAIVSQSETLPSDYPSESPSSGSEYDVQSIIVPHEEDRLSSVYSDAMVQSESELLSAQTLVRLPQPTFMVRVKKAPSPPRTPEPDYVVQNALSQSLTTILERDESLRGASRPASERAFTMTESEDDMLPPPALLPHPLAKETLIVETHEPPRRPLDIRQFENVSHEKQQITEFEDVIERGRRRIMVPRPPSEPESEYASEARSVSDLTEALAVAPRQPDVTTHVVDDRYNTKLTETHVTEDVEKHRRFVKQYHLKPKPLPPPKWDVAIRHYPAPKYADELESSGPEWEAASEPGSDIFRAQMMEGVEDRLSQIDVETLEHPPPPTWRVLLRVLDPPPTEQAITQVLTEEDREKWRQIITTESTLRRMLSTATVREDFEKIRYDRRYENLFESTKWDVIIRILSPPHDPARPSDETSSEAPSMSDTESLPSYKDGKRYRKYEPPSMAGGKKSNLPPVYEYDAEGNPIVRKTAGPPSSRSRQSSKSSVSGVEVRSMTETEVNFSRRPADQWSEASGPTTSVGARSHADRSHTEMTFSVPVLPDDEDTDFDDRLSGRTARSLARSGSEFTEDWRLHHDRLERYSQSSGDSKATRQRERSTSEYMEEAPHLSDFPTSADHSPEPSPPMGLRRYGQPRYYEDDPFQEPVEPQIVAVHGGGGSYVQREGHFETTEYRDGDQGVVERVQTRSSSSHQTQTRTSF